MARQIVVEIVGDASRFRNTLSSSGAEAQSWSSRVGGAVRSVGPAFAATGAAIGAGAGLIYSHGSTLEAWGVRAETVFGNNLNTVQSWADANAHAMGLTTREATNLAAGIGDLLVPMGFTREQAAGMSTDLVGLSGALSEWTGGQYSAEDVSHRLAAALMGERESLKALGISISEADVQQRVLEMGMGDLTGAAREQAEAEATRQLIFEKSQDAQKAFADGQAQGLRAANEASAGIREAMDTVTTSLYGVTTAIGPMLMGLGSVVQAAGPLKSAVIGLTATIGSMTAAKKVATAASYVLGGAIRFLSGPIGWIVTAVGVLAGAWATNFLGIRDKTKAVVDWIVNAFNNVVRFFGGLPGRIAGAVRGMWDSIWQGFRGALNSIIRAWNSLGFQVPVFDIPFIGKVGGWWIGTPNLPYFHAGGLVPGVPGTDVPAILQAGERVIPRSQVRSGGSPVVIHIDHWYGSDTADLDRFADRIAMRLRMSGAF